MGISARRPSRRPTTLPRSEWYSRSAKAGFAPAMNNLAQIYRFGFVTQENPRLTFEWDSRAAQLGNPIAQLNLAADLQQGYGTLADTLKAQYWATAPLPVKDPADIAEPTFSRTLVVGAGNERMIAAMKSIGDLPENWDLAPVIARAREQ